MTADERDVMVEKLKSENAKLRAVIDKLRTKFSTFPHPLLCEGKRFNDDMKLGWEAAQEALNFVLDVLTD